MRKRATAIIIEDKKILLFRRVVRSNPHYFIFPGGGIEDGETIEQALKREVKEELSLDVIEHKHLFDMEVELPPLFSHDGKQEYKFFLIDKYEGIPEVGGPEKEKSSQENQYNIDWIQIDSLTDKKNLYPQEPIEKLVQYLKQ